MPALVTEADFDPTLPTSPIIGRALLELADAVHAPPRIRSVLAAALDRHGDGLLPPEIARRFWISAASEPSLRDLGAFGPALLPRGAFEIVEMLATSASDVRQGLRGLADASDVLWGAPVFEMAERADGSAALVYRSPQPRARDAGALAAEVALGSIVALIRRATHDDEVAPRELQLRGAPHGRPAALEMAFGCPLRVGAALDRLELPGELLARQVHATDSRMRRMAERVVELERARRAAVNVTLAAHSALRRIVLAPSSALAATDALSLALSIGPRPLRARLAGEGAHLRPLLDRARRHAADRLLLSGVPPDDAHRELGYGDPGSFRRACRRWWGIGPRARREVLLEGASPGRSDPPDAANAP